MPEPTRQYIFSDGQIRAAFAGVTVLMVLTLLVLLLLISARPQGTFESADERQADAALERAGQELSGYRELDNGSVEIDIGRAIELIAERGVTNPFTATTTGAGTEADTGAAAGGLPDGSQVYGACAGCHQANGEGVPSTFPPLSGHAADLYQADPEYLAEVVLFGLQGPIEVEGVEYNGMMPPWSSYSDAEIAAVLNYILSSWENADRIGEDQPYDEASIADVRSLGLNAQQVYEHRNELDLP